MDEPLRVVVDGEHFEVRRRADVPGQYDYTWTSGPNPGYGFSAASSHPADLDPSMHERLIKSFLEAVDPETGVIEDTYDEDEDDTGDID